MSEQIKPNPEKWEAPEPWTANCSNDECPVDEYTRDGSNTAMVDYPESRQCNFLYSQCPRCNYSLRIYVENLDPEEANIRGYQIIDDEPYPTDAIHEEWLGVKGHQVPPVYELTTRHEAEIAKFGQTLVAMTESDPSLLTQMMTDPAPPQTMPQRWVGE